ncbi:MAG: response regulator transcription factor [Actinomycetota bacterium]|nr:response regulator transcription factor [Actinomycetota bacterium]
MTSVTPANPRPAQPPTGKPPAAKPRVLVVDDEDNISFLVESALQLDGIDTAKATDGHQAVAMVRSYLPHAIVLDVMMPGIDGFEVLRRLRSDGVKTPVLFLTARDTVDDRVRGLTIGGDDYILKPFAIAELVARVRVALRHAGIDNEGSVLHLADLELDQAAYRVTRAGQPVTLSPTEFKLLRYLLVNAGRVLTRAQILDHVWSYDFGGDASVVETYMSYLRRKIDTVEPKLLHTVRGVGYCLRVDG